MRSRKPVDLISLSLLAAQESEQPQDEKDGDRCVVGCPADGGAERRPDRETEERRGGFEGGKQDQDTPSLSTIDAGHSQSCADCEGVEPQRHDESDDLKHGCRSIALGVQR